MHENIVFTTLRPEESADTLIIACHTIRKELEHAMTVTGIGFPVIYLKSSLHDTPKILHETLQTLIHEASENKVKRILLGYATCGNSVAGLETGDCQVIFPRTDDCVTFFLGSMEQRRKLPSGTYFVTHGWLYDEGHGQSYYDEIMERYGAETGKEIYDMMMENYNHVGIVDTHCYEMDSLTKDACAFAQCLGLDVLKIDGRNTYLEQLLTGPWDAEHFFVFEPKSQIAQEELTLP